MSITERIDAITKIAADCQTEKPPVPRSVKIELTARCNFDCFFCASGQRLRKRQDMDFDLYKRLVSELRELGTEELGLFYLGESFLLKWLPDAIEYAKRECGFPYVFLTTNGHLSTPDRLAACMNAGLDSLKFSFNHSDSEQFHAVTGVPASGYDVVKSNIKSAATIRDDVERVSDHRCGLYASSILYDGEQRIKMRKAVEEILPFVDEHYFLPLYNQGALTTSMSEELGYVPTAGNQGRIGALRDPVPCWSAFTEGHITHDGHLSACCFDHSANWGMGDLKEQSFMEAWHSPDFQALRAAHLRRDLTNTACAKCVAYS